MNRICIYACTCIYLYMVYKSALQSIYAVLWSYIYYIAVAAILYSGKYISVYVYICIHIYYLCIHFILYSGSSEQTFEKFQIIHGTREVRVHAGTCAHALSAVRAHTYTHTVINAYTHTHTFFLQIQKHAHTCTHTVAPLIWHAGSACAHMPWLGYVRHAATWQIFAKVSSSLNLVYEMTWAMTFEKFSFVVRCANPSHTISTKSKNRRLRLRVYIVCIDVYT